MKTEWSERTLCLHGPARSAFPAFPPRTHLPAQRRSQNIGVVSGRVARLQRWLATLPIQERSRSVISRSDLQEFVVHLRERGVKPVSCNCYLRGLNAFCRWLHTEGHASQPVRLPPFKVEKRLLPVHNDRALRLILSYRPKTFVQWRVHSVACTILDTGCRIDELLTARVIDCDFDSLLLTVVGKGRKQRKVPCSIELRKLLFRFGQIKQRADVRSELMFPARDGGQWECTPKLLLPSEKSRTSADWLSLAAPHLRNSIPAARWRCRAALDHPWAHGSLNDHEVFAPVDGRSPASSSGIVDSESPSIVGAVRWRSLRTCHPSSALLFFSLEMEEKKESSGLPWQLWQLGHGSRVP